MLGLSDIYVFAVFPGNGTTRVGPLLPRYMIPGCSENVPQCVKRFLGIFNVVASQYSFYGFRNVTNVRNNRTSGSGFIVLRGVRRRSNWFAQVTKDGESRTLDICRCVGGLR